MHTISITNLVQIQKIQNLQPSIASTAVRMKVGENTSSYISKVSKNFKQCCTHFIALSLHYLAAAIKALPDCEELTNLKIN